MVLLRSSLCEAILVHCSSRCLAVVFAMAMTEASATAEVASATAEKIFSAVMIREHAARSPPQPFERFNEALKHYRDLFEVGFIPQVFQHNLDLEPDTLLIRKVTHGSGEEFHFEAGTPPVAFSWSQMLLATGQKFEHVVGVGVVAVLMFVRPDSYDHCRGHAFVKANKTPPMHRPPIWDFLVKRADGTGILLHPRWRRKGGIEILPFERMPHAVSPVPSAGVGKSDGKGTYRRTKNAAYTSKAKEPPPLPVAPATAGLSPTFQPNDTDFHQLLRAAAAQGAVPPPPPPPALAIAREAQSSSSQSACKEMPPPPPHEVPRISWDAAMRDGPVLPPPAVPATAGESDALSSASWFDVVAEL